MADNITPQDQFEEIIEFIRTTDKVLGDPPGTQGALSGPINKVLQKIANSLLNLKTRLDGLNITVPNASTTVKGIAELATKLEAETGTDTTRIIVAKRVYDILKHANAQATTTTRGTAFRADETKGRSGTDDEAMITSLRLLDFLRNGTGAEATTEQKGTVQKATENDVKNNQNTGRVVTVDSLYRTVNQPINASIPNLPSQLTLSNFSHSSTFQTKYFGPIFYGTSGSATISGTFNSSHSFAGTGPTYNVDININSEIHKRINTVSVVGDNLTQMGFSVQLLEDTEQIRLRVRVNSLAGAESGDFVITIT